MTPEHLPLIALCIFVIAFLYSSVGHAGASGYIAVLSLFSVTPAVIKPTALALNILVAAICTWQFWRAGHFSWRLFWPFALLSVPCAFAGGYFNLPTHYFKILVGVVLLYSAARFLIKPPLEQEPTAPDRPAAISIGAGIGLLSGLTGTGGGIFLSPLLIFMAWSTTKGASGVAAVFILCNSIAGLLGNLASVKSLPPELPLYVGAVLAGAAIGSAFGVKLPAEKIRKALGVVLLIAGAKLFGVY